MIYKNLFSFLFLVLFLSQVVSAANPEEVNLGYAGSFAILSKSGISTTGTTSIVGNIGVSPIDSTGITGFGLIMDSSNTFSTSSLVTGRVYAADYTPPSPSFMTTAIGDMEIAYTDAAGRTNPTATELGAGDISGMTITPGLYKWGTGVMINTGVTLDCQGNSSAVYIFQIAQDLSVGNGAIVTLAGNCQARNIFWQVAGQATLGTTADFKGIVLSKTLIGMNTGATLNGRALAQTAVTLDANAVTVPTGTTLVLTKITVSPTSANLTLNSTLQLNATSRDQFGSPIAATITYTSSNSAIATVNSTTGLVTSIAFGNATITALSGTTVNGSAAINVSPDNTAPNITLFSLSASNVFTGEAITGTCTAIDDFDSNPNITITGIDTSITGTRNATCTASDSSNNTNQSTLSYTVNQKPSSGSSSSGGGSSGVNWPCTEWTVCSSNGTRTKTCSQPHSSGMPFASKLEQETCTPIRINTTQNALSQNASGRGTQSSLNRTGQNTVTSGQNNNATGGNPITGFATVGSFTWWDQFVNWIMHLFG